MVTVFSKDIGMQFGESKCAYLQIQKGKNVTSNQPLVMNGLSLKPIEEGDCYGYLGQDENISYVGEVNKKRVSKEYFTRLKKIWSSELCDFNKVIAQN